MRVALDTNFLANAEGVNGAAMREKALGLLRRLPAESVVLPVQALGELFHVLVVKARRPAGEARAAVLSWRDAYGVAGTSEAAMVSAADAVADRGVAIWDSVMLAASAEAGCRLLLSEDLEEGFTWRGVTVTNPLVGRVHPLLGALLREREE